MLALEGMMNAQRNRSMYLRVGERLAEIRKSRKIWQAKLAMSAADKPPEQLWTTAMPPRKCMSHADECVRLAGLTDDLIIRDQLLDLAQEWMLAAQRARRLSDTRVMLLHKNLGDNVVPWDSNHDDDDR